MRYQVGQQLHALHINTGGNFGSLWRSPHRFGRIDDILDVTIKILTVTEHHRVPGEWDDIVQYDGYVLTDAEGKKWHNQYPRASYGQLSDEGDRMFWRDGDDIDKPEPILQMRLLTDFMDSLYEGVLEIAKEKAEDQPIGRAINSLYERIENECLSQILTKKLVRVPLRFEKLDGGFIAVPGRWVHELQPVSTENSDAIIAALK